MTSRATPLFCTAAVLLLVACGGGDGVDGVGQVPSEDGASGRGSGGPFTGRLIGAFGNTFTELDLATGRYAALPSGRSLLERGFFEDHHSVQTRRDRSVSSGTIVTLDGCLADRAEAICVFFLDADGSDTGAFAIDGRFSGVAKASFDGTHVAIDRRDRDGGLSTMSIFTRDGAFVSSHSQSGPTDDDGPYDWLPDGRLVYSIEGSELLGDPQPTGFIITDPYDATPRRRITLPDYYQEGDIRTIESSPDGSRLLMLVEPRVGPRRPILVDVDTLGVTQLVDREDSIIDVNRVVWGPDGRWGLRRRIDLPAAVGALARQFGRQHARVHRKLRVAVRLRSERRHAPDAPGSGRSVGVGALDRHRRPPGARRRHRRRAVRWRPRLDALTVRRPTASERASPVGRHSAARNGSSTSTATDSIRAKRSVTSSITSHEWRVLARHRAAVGQDAGPVEVDGEPVATTRARFRGDRVPYGTSTRANRSHTSIMSSSKPPFRSK